MIDWGAIAGKFVSMIMSWMQAGNLRNRMYLMAEEAEIMHTGLEDIVRMDPNGHMGAYAKKVLDLVKNLE